MSGSTLQRKPKRGRRIMDPAERAAFKAARQSEDRERMMLAESALQTPEGWRAFLETRARFSTYSPRNCMLIAQQCPHATAVASFKTWQSLGRHVRKGEHGIRILAPITVRTAVADDRKRPGLSTPNSIAQQCAAVRTSIYDADRGETETRVAFKSVPVFDISQTDGDELEDDPRNERVDVSAWATVPMPTNHDEITAALAAVAGEDS